MTAMKLQWVGEEEGGEEVLLCEWAEGEERKKRKRKRTGWAVLG